MSFYLCPLPPPPSLPAAVRRDCMCLSPTGTQGSGDAWPGPHSPVSLLKLRLQVPDPVPGPWVLLLQQVQAIDHWRMGREGTGELAGNPSTRGSRSRDPGSSGAPRLFQNRTFSDQQSSRSTKCVRLGLSRFSQPSRESAFNRLSHTFRRRSDRALERRQDLTEATVYKLGLREGLSTASPKSLLTTPCPRPQYTYLSSG